MALSSSVRRALALIAALATPLLLAAPPAGAATVAPASGGRVSGPAAYPAPAYDDPAGHTCPFAIHVSFPVNKTKVYTYRNSQGRVVAHMYVGALFAEVTRRSNGVSRTVDLSGSAVQTIHQDGSSDFYGFGPFSVSLHPGDQPHPGLMILDGVSLVKLLANGHKRIIYTSRAYDLCDRLAAPGTAPTPPAPYSDGHVSGPAPYPALAYDDPAGHTCPFAIHVSFPVNKTKTYTYRNGQGRVVAYMYVGALFAEVTRRSNGGSRTVDLSGSGVQILHRDGSSDFYGFGPFSVSLHPGDRPGPGYQVLDGVSLVKLLANGHKRIIYTSRSFDLCGRLR
jgi:hypothetical protein